MNPLNPVIEKGYPIPKARKSSGPHDNLRKFVKRYPWNEMEVGDSFFVPGKKYISLIKSVKDAERRFPGKKWRGATQRAKDQPHGARIWRVE